MAKQIRGTYPEKLTRAGDYLASLLEELGLPIVPPFTFYQLIGKMYQEREGKRLYLRREEPNRDDYYRLRQNLSKTGLIRYDRDYGGRMMRVTKVSDLQAEDVICLADPICYVSHLSAMQRWNLTDRRSGHLIITRPDRKTARAKLHEIIANTRLFETPDIWKLKNATHPEVVRRRQIHVFESKTFGSHLTARGTHTYCDDGTDLPRHAPKTGTLWRHVSCARRMGRARPRTS